MKHSSRHSTQSLRLPDFEHRLSMYALAASAAGVGMLALAQPAEGKIIYTKTNKQIGADTTFRLDLNHDGIADFSLKNTGTSTTMGGGREWLSAIPAQRNAVWGHTMWGAYASALSPESWVGPKGQFLQGAGLMASYSIAGGKARPASLRGPWCDVTSRYLGLKFVIKGKTHFGWARLNVSCGLNLWVVGTLTGYAYETTPNHGILTGKEHGADDSMQPGNSGATLGQLATGVKSRPHE